MTHEVTVERSSLGSQAGCSCGWVSLYYSPDEVTGIDRAARLAGEIHAERATRLVSS